jgi:hypothetical protein
VGLIAGGLQLQSVEEESRVILPTTAVQVQVTDLDLYSSVELRRCVIATSNYRVYANLGTGKILMLGNLRSCNLGLYTMLPRHKELRESIPVYFFWKDYCYMLSSSRFTPFSVPLDLDGRMRTS